MPGDEPKKAKKSKAKEKRAKAKASHKTSLAGGAANAAGVKAMVDELSHKYGKDESDIYAAYDRFDNRHKMFFPFSLFNGQVHGEVSDWNSQ